MNETGGSTHTCTGSASILGLVRPAAEPGAGR
jgi:hypothetical protein